MERKEEETKVDLQGWASGQQEARAGRQAEMEQRRGREPKACKVTEARRGKETKEAVEQCQRFWRLRMTTE